MNEQPELNPQYVINSLINQIADNSAQTALQIANLNAVIAEQAEQLRNKEVAEMDEIPTK